METVRHALIGAVVLGMLLSVSTASAGVFENVVLGLEYAGFNFAGQKNPVSGGAEFELSRNFNNETLDFGATDLTLTGPLDFTFSTGGRQLPVLDFSINTGNQAFQYIYETSTGSQDMRVEGNFLLDATGSVNAFGFYDMRLQLSSRQDVTLDGRYQEGLDELDYDIGPIDISGNIFADMLARLFDPICEGLGIPNIFDSFSGRSQRDDLLQLIVADAEAEAKAYAEQSILGEQTDNPTISHGLTLDTSLRGRTLTEGDNQPVPEPSLAFLMVGPIVYLVARRRRW